jgi:hypothetical protein
MLELSGILRRHALAATEEAPEKAVHPVDCRTRGVARAAILPWPSLVADDQQL